MAMELHFRTQEHPVKVRLTPLEEKLISSITETTKLMSMDSKVIRGCIKDKSIASIDMVEASIMNIVRDMAHRSDIKKFPNLTTSQLTLTQKWMFGGQTTTELLSIGILEFRRTSVNTNKFQYRSWTHSPLLVLLIYLLYELTTYVNIKILSIII